jgi:hypothetical protein
MALSESLCRWLVFWMLEFVEEFVEGFEPAPRVMEETGFP